jgi:hypothetical protein
VDIILTLMPFGMKMHDTFSSNVHESHPDFDTLFLKIRKDPERTMNQCETNRENCKPGMPDKGDGIHPFHIQDGYRCREKKHEKGNNPQVHDQRSAKDHKI